MLKIICGNEPENLLNTSSHIFKLNMKPEWFNDPLVEEMVLDVDKTKHFKDQVFESPVLGFITPERLSGGVKGLIGIVKCDKFRKFDALRSSIFGDNCVKWLAKLSFDYDFAIYMSHALDFSFGGNSEDEEFQNTPINAVGKHGEVLSTCGEVADYYFKNYDFCVDESANDSEDSEDSPVTLPKPKYEHTAEYLHSREFYEKNAPYYDYLVAWDDPVTQEYIRLSEEFDKSKTEEERQEIISKLSKLRW